MGEATDKINTTNWDEDRITSTQPDDSYSASVSTDDYDEDTENLRAEIEDTRAEMSQTINEIQERLSPENVMEQVKEKVREATVGKVEKVMNRVGETIGEVTEPAREAIERAGSTIKETGKSAADVIWKNPIPIALVGLGLGMIVVRAVRTNGSDYDDMSRTGSRIGRQSLTGNQKRNRTGQSNRFAQVLRENPLAVGAVAIAAGTAVGLVLPATRLENEYIGETSGKFVDKAQEVAREAIDKVQNVAQQQMASQPQSGD